MFPGRWMGGCVSIEWPSKSMDPLQNQIVNTFQQISTDLHKKVYQSLKRQLQTYIQAKGVHFEQDYSLIIMHTFMNKRFSDLAAKLEMNR